MKALSPGILLGIILGYFIILILVKFDSQPMIYLFKFQKS